MIVGIDILHGDGVGSSTFPGQLGSNSRSHADTSHRARLQEWEGTFWAQGGGAHYEYW